MSNKAEESGLVPKRRFPEFREKEEWVAKPFDELFTIGNGKDYKHLSSGDVPVYGSGGYMLSVNDYLYDGESVCIGRKGTINNPMLLAGKFWTVDTLFYTHSFNDCLPRFIYSIFQNIDWLKHNEAGGVPSLSKTNIKKIKVAVPKPKEQQKIADCLASLDELITVEAKELDTLKTHKKGLMQQLFPAEGERLPKLRFPEFRDAGAWEERRLGDVCEKILDGTHFSPKSKSGPRLYLTSKNIQNGEIDLSNISYISEEEHREIYKRCSVKKNDVLLTKDGANTGNCALNNIDYEFSLLSSVAVLRGIPSLLEQKFLYQLILADRTQKTIQESLSGQAITRITLEKIGNFVTLITDIKEQQKIADCLASLDDLVTAQTQKLAALKTHKKGLMQQLFPTLPEAAA